MNLIQLLKAATEAARIQLRRAAAERHRGAKVPHAAGVTFHSIPGHVTGRERSEQILREQIGRLHEQPRAVRDTDCMEELAAKIDAWGLEWEWMNPHYSQTEWNARHELDAYVTARMAVGYGYAVRVKPALNRQVAEAAMQHMMQESAENTESVKIEAAFSELQRELSEAGECTVELVAAGRDNRTLHLLLRVLEKARARFDAGVGACECGEPGCRGRLESLRMSPATLAALTRRLERLCEAEGQQVIYNEQGRVVTPLAGLERYLQLLRAHTFVRAALGQSTPGEIMQAVTTPR